MQHNESNYKYGKVKFFDPKKGFGFIIPDEGQDLHVDVFVHASALEKSGIDVLDSDQRVRFQLNRNKKTGKVGAVDVSIL